MCWFVDMAYKLRKRYSNFTNTVEFAKFVTSRGLEKSDELHEVTNYANR